GAGGQVTINSGSAIITEQDNSHGVVAESIGGGGGKGGSSFVFSLAAGVIPEIPVAINIGVSVGGSGGGGGSGGIVQVENGGGIATGGSRSFGILAQSVGGGGGDGGSASTVTLSVNCNASGTVAVGGNGALGGDGKEVDVTNSGSIVTQGALSTGILAQSVGGGGGTGGSSTTVGIELEIPTSEEELKPSPKLTFAGSIGGNGGAGGNGGPVTVTNGNIISTSGDLAYGILAQSVGGGGGAGGEARSYDIAVIANPVNYSPVSKLWTYSAELTLGGDGSNGGTGSNVAVTNNGTIFTRGASALGIIAQSVGGGGGAGGDTDTYKLDTTDLIPTDKIPVLGDILSKTSFSMELKGGDGGAGDGGSTTVTNSGTIITQGAGAHGILAQSIGGGGGYVAVVNPYGTTTTSFSSNVDGVLTQTSGAGASFIGSLGGSGNGGSVTVTNSGTIITTGQGAHGIFAQSAGGLLAGDVTVIAGGNIFAQGVDSDAILAQSLGGTGNGNITVKVLTGTVQGGSGSGAGVYLKDGANNTLTNQGTITTVLGAAGTAILGDGGNETINNNGTVTGSVNFGQGTHAFNNNSGALLNSGTTINLGSGNTLTNAGTISPGGSANFLTTQLSGNFVQKASGAMQMDIGGGGKYDELVVTGSASLDGTLSVAKTHGLYRDGAVYDVVKTAGNGGITGSFANVVLPQAMPLLSFTVDQQPGQVDVNVHAPKFTTIATNRTQFSTAGYLDRICPTATGDLWNALGEFQSLPASQLAPALASIHPGSYDNYSKASYQGMWEYIGSVQQRMSTVRSYSSVGQDIDSKPLLLAFDGSPDQIRALFPTGELSQTQAKNGLWFNGFDQWGDQGGSDGFAGFGYTVYGGTLGFDHTFSDNITAGLSVGYGRTDVDLHFGLGDGNINSWTGSLYGSYSKGNGYVEGALSYGRNGYSNSRSVMVGSDLREAESSHDGNAYSAYLGGGYYFDVGSGFSLGPFAAFRYVYLSEDGFSETGADSLDLNVNHRTTDAVVSDLGLRLAKSFKTGEGYLIPELSAGGRYDSGSAAHVITASLAGSPDAAFSVRSPGIEKYGLLTGASLTYVHKSGLSTSLTYSGEFRQSYKAQSILGQLRYPF
ncbi:MAG TPA: autotransporter domain-containing protein, partial [Syntrophorhabdales bacterium]|nr:autotransporter domain-containing protein [Syntrophorhabdales bacterium]